MVEDAKKDQTLPDSILALADGDPERARVLWVKFRLVEAFPITYEEIDSPLVYDYNNHYWNQNKSKWVFIPPGRRRYLAAYKTQLDKERNGGPKNYETQQAACLRLALSVRRAGSSLADLNLPVMDTDGDGVMELVDSWGTAFGFYRFPTCPLLQAHNPDSVALKDRAHCRDPLDPNGRLIDLEYARTKGWKSSPNPWRGLTPLHIVCNYQSYSPTDFYPYYSIPVIVSAGPDRKLGLGYNNMGSAVYSEDFDNIFSFLLK